MSFIKLRLTLGEQGLSVERRRSCQGLENFGPSRATWLPSSVRLVMP